MAALMRPALKVLKLLTLLAVVATPLAAWGQGGVLVDADGVVRLKKFKDPGGQLHQQRVAAARAALEQKIAGKSDLRKVSLTRLEAAIADALDHNRPVSDDMRHLAGLTRIRYVFFYPETNDIVLAGPAEGWVDDLAGRTVGIESGRPTLLLEDLIVALRAYAPDGNQSPVISVSIDPTPEGLKRMQQFLIRQGGQFRPGDEPAIVDGLRNSLGLQKVSIGGVSPKTHFAQVLVEADYRMKLIGIGLENPGVGIVSYVAKANPAAVSANALKRWYFVPNYECLRVSDDSLSAELVGDGVKLVGEDEVVGADGRRSSVAKSDKASTMFTDSFTQRYGKLSAKVPVYGQLRNCIDLAVMAAEIRAAGWATTAHWQMPVFRDEKRYAVEVHNTPVQVETAVNAIIKGNRLTTPIGGGVNIQAQLALTHEHLLADKNGDVKKAHAEVKPPRLKAGQWWWD